MPPLGRTSQTGMSVPPEGGQAFWWPETGKNACATGEGCPYSFTIVVLATTCLSDGMISSGRPASALNVAVTVTLIGFPLATLAMLAIVVLLVGSVNVTVYVPLV